MYIVLTQIIDPLNGRSSCFIKCEPEKRDNCKIAEKVWTEQDQVTVQKKTVLIKSFVETLSPKWRNHFVVHMSSFFVQKCFAQILCY